MWYILTPAEYIQNRQIVSLVQSICGDLMRQAKHFTAQMGQEDEGVKTFYTGLSLQGIRQDL